MVNKSEIVIKYRPSWGAYTKFTLHACFLMYQGRQLSFFTESERVELRRPVINIPQNLGRGCALSTTERFFLRKRRDLVNSHRDMCVVF